MILLDYLGNNWFLLLNWINLAITRFYHPIRFSNNWVLSPY